MLELGEFGIGDGTEISTDSDSELDLLYASGFGLNVTTEVKSGLGSGLGAKYLERFFNSSDTDLLDLNLNSSMEDIFAGADAGATGLNDSLLGSDEDFMNQGAGSIWIRLMVLLLYGIVCVVGLCGNSLVIYVVLRFSKMQTVTNLYIVNLAIADECFLVGIPFLMSTSALEYWPFGNIMCKIYFTTTSINQVTSSMFLLIMSADRFLAVCHPISATKWRTPLIASTVSVTAWGISGLIMVPVFMYANTREIHGKTNCNIFWPDGWIRGDATFMMYSFVLGFAIPVILISIFYFLVIIRLRHVGPKRHNLNPPSLSVTSAAAATKPSTPGSVGGTRGSSELNITPLTANQYSRARDRKKSKRKVTKLVLTVITVYFLCWAPYWISQLALISMEHETYHSNALLTIFLLAGCLSYSNSAMNPILYAFLSDNFKKSFVKACSCANRKDANGGFTMDNSMYPRNKATSRGSERRGTVDSLSLNPKDKPIPSSARFLGPNHCNYLNTPSIKIDHEAIDEEEGGFLDSDDEGAAILGNRRESDQGQTMTTRGVITNLNDKTKKQEGVHVTAL